MLEQLEPRMLCSAVVPPIPGIGFIPSQITHAYGFDSVQFSVGNSTIAGDGRGQAIAIVDAFRSPSIHADLKAFDLGFGLPDKLPSGRPLLKIAGGLTNRKLDATWQLETALDVEWAHAIAPAAQIILIEARSDSPADLFKAVNLAKNQRGVSVVSMSWGFDTEPSGINFQSIFATPPKHVGPAGKGDGITFVEAAADNGAPNAFPDPSINVVSVGGTDLALNGNEYESESPFPSSISPATVAFAATSFDVYHAGLWSVAGGTSAAAPQWAALLAIADQGRTLSKKHTLDGATQTLPALTALSPGDFHLISGANSATGYGSPFADRLIIDLVSL
jgi:subtilase family serine protease